MPSTLSLRSKVRACLLVLFVFIGRLVVVSRVVAGDGDVTLSIPAVDIQAFVVEIELKQFSDGSVSWDTTSLDPNVGHLQGTAWFDAPGNIVLVGHSRLAQRRLGIFAALHQLQIGDAVIVSRGDGQRRYIVTEIRRVDPTDLTPVYPTVEERLTLITCDIDSYVASSDSYSKRLIVVAERES